MAQMAPVIRFRCIKPWSYEAAGYTPNDGNAARLKGNERIKKRVAELQECSAAQAAVTLQGLIEEAEDIQARRWLTKNILLPWQP